MIPRGCEQLPDTSGLACEFVVAREQRSGYDHAVRAAGARLIEVGFHEIVANAGVRRAETWEYETAFCDQTAGVFYVYDPDSKPPLAELVVRAHKRGVCVLVDAAGELPPRDNLTTLVDTGADLVAFSGGKAIRGPQGTGILCGRRDLIAAAALQMLDLDEHWELWDPPRKFIDKSRLPGLPRHGIGRGMKVSKEEVVALLAALDLFSSGDYDGDVPRFRALLERIVAAVRSRPSRARSAIPATARARRCWRSPSMNVRWDARPSRCAAGCETARRPSMWDTVG